MENIKRAKIWFFDKIKFLGKLVKKPRKRKKITIEIKKEVSKSISSIDFDAVVQSLTHV